MAKADEERLAPGELAEIAGTRAPAQPLGDQQHDAVDHQEGGGHRRGAEQAAQEMFQGEADDDRRDRADDDHQEELPVRRHRRRTAAAEKGEEDVDPLAPEIDQQGGRRAEMQHDQKGQEGRQILVEGPAEQGWYDDGMGQAADREELGHALKGGQENRLQQ